jgi:hypothetical protein
MHRQAAYAGYGALLLLAFNVAARADDPRADETSYYQLSSQFQGFCKSLDIQNDGRENKTPILARTDFVSGQHWKMSRAPNNGYYYLTTEWQGLGKRLDILNDGVNNTPVLAGGANYTGQLWRIDPAGDGNFFLSTYWRGSGNRLDVINDATASRLTLKPAAHVSGQRWRFTKVTRVGPVPSSLGVSAFYKKYVDADGIPVLGSDKVSDTALYRARFIILQVLSGRADIRDQMIAHGARVAIMGASEQTSDIPEHSNLALPEDEADQTQDPQVFWNGRARGLGGVVGAPLTTGAEENLLCQQGDRYAGEDIFLHEFAHGIHHLGVTFVDPNFEADLQAAYDDAKAEGRWQENADLYALDNPIEYFAEGVQSWFNVNAEPNAVHNDVNTRAELETYDPQLYALVAKFFPADVSPCSCQ